jgi:hypothetical protein
VTCRDGTVQVVVRRDGRIELFAWDPDAHRDSPCRRGPVAEVVSSCEGTSLVGARRGHPRCRCHRPRPRG